MKKALAAGLILAGIIAVSGTSLAEAKAVQNIHEMREKANLSKQRPPEPPRDFDGKRPPMMSRDIRSNKNRPPLPPDNKHPRVSRDRRPDEGKRPPMPPRSGDRRPPEFDRATKQQGVEPR